MTSTRRKTRATRPPSGDSSPTDAVRLYAEGVVEGRIIVGPHVRGACKRHLRDLDRVEIDGFEGRYYDLEAADRAIAFFREVLTVLEDGQVVPFELCPGRCDETWWQAFVVGSLFGWKREDGTRRFRTFYGETGKGSGKSPLAAGVGHYMLVADGEARAEVYAAATKKDQAMILFNDAVAMRDSSSELRDRLIPSGVNPVYRLSHYKSGSFFKPISSDDGQSGPRPSCALVDELHEHKTRDTVTILDAGFKFRRQPLLFLITNSGSDKKTVCGEYHDHAVAVCAGERFDEEFFAYVCALDEGEDPFKNEACWIKANPTLGRTIKLDYLRKQVSTARAIPGNQNTVLRLNFCVWTEADSAWMTREAWQQCEDATLEMDDFEDADCYGGLDLSFVKDLTAAAWVFPEVVDQERELVVDDETGETITVKVKVETLVAFVDFWTPADTLAAREEKDRVPYQKWVEAGHMRATPGKVIKLVAVGSRLGDVVRRFNVKGIAYDAYREKELDDDLEELALEEVAELLHEHPQGFRRAKLYDRRGKPVVDDDGNHADNPLWMPASVAELENMIIEGTLVVFVNPVLRWNVGAAVIREDPAGTGGKVFSKLKATGRIDGLVALAMAVGLAKARKVRGKSLNGFLRNPVMAA